MTSAGRDRDLALLTGPDAGDILRAALAPAGGQLLDWRPTHVDYQPRSGSTAGYAARVRWVDGRVTHERFGAFTGTPPDRALTVGNGEDQVTVWRFPYDPYLPGLATGYDPAGAAALAAAYRLGEAPPRVSVRAYRPRRRAVIALTGPNGQVFLKVVRPHRVAALHERHRLCGRAGVPVPRSLGYTPSGVLVLSPLAGRSLRDALRHGDDAAPSAEAVVGLLDRLPAELVDSPPRPGWAERAAHYAEVMAGILPDQAAQARHLATEIMAARGPRPIVPVHGDLYENQLWVATGRITGLLDIDTAGPGQRLDDLACLLGHLAVLAQIRPAQAAAIDRLTERYLAAFEAALGATGETAADPVDLRHRVAAVVLSLATGPHRVQEPGWPGATRSRLELAVRWVESARRPR